MKKLIIALIIICFVGCAFFFLLILQTPSRTEPQPVISTVTPHKQEPVKPPETSYSLPVRLKIPKISVDATIEHLGLTAEGDMQKPAKLQNVGWYKLGQRPGNKGSAVIAGHYGLSSNDISVFNKLHTLDKGDIVQVVDEKGAVATFVVNELKTYDKNAAAPEVFTSNDEKAHLNLVTCKGTWQGAQQTYSDRLVVFTDSK